MLGHARQPCEIDGVDLGMVYMTKPTTSVRVVDQAAFLAWVSEHAPGAIVTRTVTEVSPAWVKSILAKGCTDDGEVPDGLGEVTGKPIWVTEHGADLPTARDAERATFITASLGGLHDAISDGVPVTGYVHWSLTDNWEGEAGAAPRTPNPTSPAPNAVPERSAR